MQTLVKPRNEIFTNMYFFLNPLKSVPTKISESTVFNFAILVKDEEVKLILLYCVLKLHNCANYVILPGHHRALRNY